MKYSVESRLTSAQYFVEEISVGAVRKHDRPRKNAVGGTKERIAREQSAAGEARAPLIDKFRNLCRAAASITAKFEFSVDDQNDCFVPTHYLAPILLIANEAIKNAIKYAHPTGVEGKIAIGLTEDEDGAVLIEIADDGVGFPEGFEPSTDGGYGLHLMRQLSKQLDAKLMFHSSGLGLSVQLKLPATDTIPMGNGAANDEDHAAADRLIQDLISGRKPDGVLGDDGRWRQIFQELPAAIYTTDAVGRITFYNEAAAAMWGCRPELGKSEFCGSWKLFWPDGQPMPHEMCPMAMALQKKQPMRGFEAIAERPDGTRVPFIPYPTPLFGSSGLLIGAVNMLVDISERKCAEETVARHLNEQSALYRFTDGLFRASSLSDVCDAALAAIGQALGCRRSSILLFDQASVMRFVAWSGLSDAYRSAVEGHSPWTRETKNPQPICIDNIASADFPTALKSVIEAEGIVALAFIPIVADDEIIGKFMTYYDVPHNFMDAEVNLSLTIARQLGFALERMRSEQARSRAEQTSRLLASIVETSGDAIVSKTLDGTITSWNSGAKRVFGYDSDEVVGKSIMLLIPPDRHEEERNIIDRVRRGMRVEHYDTVRRRKNGTPVDISLMVSPVMDATGRIVGASKIARDISEKKRYEAQQSLLLHEMTHRVKNTLATVQAMAGQTLRSVSKDELRSFMSRLHALAAAYDLLTSENWDRAAVRDIVNRAAEPFKAERFSVHGPEFLVSAGQALKLTMVLHELATNAVKYGALSNAAGTVEIAWRHKGTERLHISWQERGGPAVTPPEHKGFGSRLVEQSTDNLVCEFAPLGLECTFSIMA
jgi:PAS domain S-box-containing protein